MVMDVAAEAAVDFEQPAIAKVVTQVSLGS